MVKGIIHQAIAIAAGRSLPRRRMACVMASLVALALAVGLIGCAGFSRASNAPAAVSVIFVYAGQARSVCLAGDFNGWSTRSHCLDFENDRWQIRLTLAPGMYRYAFIVDDSRWVADPDSLFQESDGFGRSNGWAVIQ
jgi:1,4-alpha-glucan branching enzyme